MLQLKNILTAGRLQVLKAGDTMTGPLNINPPGRLALMVITDVATVVLKNREMSVQFGNLAVGTTASGPGLDIRKTSNMPGGGIRIKNSADTEFFQLCQNSRKLGLEVCHTDNIESSTNIELDAVTG